MITLRNITTTFLLSLIFLFSACQDEDFGFTEQDVWKGVYSRNFIKTFGEVDPHENWDFSQFGRRNSLLGKTRAGETPYIVSDVLRDKLLRGTLAEGVDHFDPRFTFCFLSGNDHFSLTPIYRSGTATEWCLHLAVFTPSGESKDVVVWSNEQDNVLEIQTTHCDICDDRGYVSATGGASGAIECPNCTGGHIAHETCDFCAGLGTYKGETCPYCDGNKKLTLSTQTCTHCNAEGKIEIEGGCNVCQGSGIVNNSCITCGGKGFQETSGSKGTKNYIICSKCGEDGHKGEVIFGGFKKNELKNDPTKKAAYEAAMLKFRQDYPDAGKIICSECEGTGFGEKDCPLCDNKKLYVCPICNETNEVVPCNATVHISGESWIPITGTNPELKDTKTASGIQGYTVSTSTLFADFFGSTAIPTGTIFYFYLVADGNTVTSMDGGMREISTTGLGLGETDKIIGCEEGDGSGSCDNDFNDLVFILHGSPRVIQAEENVEFETIIRKRYLAEDFGSNADWDFNDVVVDVERKSYQKLSGSGTELELVPSTTRPTTTTATIVYLSGTLPITITVGTTSFYRIQDPTDHLLTYDDLNNVPETEKIESAEDKKSIGWQVKFTKPVVGWDPDRNNITIKVEKEGGFTDQDSSSGADVWQSAFPNPGDVPYIIATEATATTNWITTDGNQVWTLDWFSQKYPNVHK